MTNRENFEIYLRTQRGDLKPRHFNGILHLKHNEDFSLVIENNSLVKVKAECFISGENIGTIVLKIGQKLVLSRPIDGIDRKFRYATFGSNIAKIGKLQENNLHSDEVTVVIRPEEPYKFRNGCDCDCAICLQNDTADGALVNSQRYASAGSNSHKHSMMNMTTANVRAACAAVPEGIKIESDGVSKNLGGAVLGPNRSFQNFVKVHNFQTKGEYYFTILLRTLEDAPDIIPVGEMQKYW